MSKTIEQLQQEYSELDKEAGQYKRAEFDAVYSIISELTKDNPDVGDGGNLGCPLVEGATIDEAMKLAGYADDEAFISDFKKYREIEQRAREVQIEGLTIILEEQEYVTPHSGEWYFVPIRILTTESMQSAVEQIIINDAKDGKGLFANTTYIPLEDENIDSWFDIEEYGLKCSLEPIYRELHQCGIIDSILSSKDIRDGYLITLKELICCLKDNTDKPNKVRNYITNTLKAFDNVPIYGLILQMLLLQGFCRWLECIDINEGDSGYNEGCCMYDWLLLRLLEKELYFCFMKFGDNDLKRLEPLCNYLYSSDIGKMVQNAIKEKFYPELQSEQLQANKSQQGTQTPQLPEELDTILARKIFAKAVEVGLMKMQGDYYKWLNKSKARLAYMLEKIYCIDGRDFPEDALNTLFQEGRLGKARSQLANNKGNDADKNSAGKPKGYQTIDILFEDKEA
ncbi:MAG: hypothetical protein SNH66_05845 [Rikenellaceae bacterium]